MGPPNLDSSALAPLATRLATLQDAACRETLQASSRGQMIMSDASGFLGGRPGVKALVPPQGRRRSEKGVNRQSRWLAASRHEGSRAPL